MKKSLVLSFMFISMASFGADSFDDSLLFTPSVIRAEEEPMDLFIQNEKELRLFAEDCFVEFENTQKISRPFVIWNSGKVIFDTWVPFSKIIHIGKNSFKNYNKREIRALLASGFQRYGQMKPLFNVLSFGALALFPVQVLLTSSLTQSLTLAPVVKALFDLAKTLKFKLLGLSLTKLSIFFGFSLLGFSSKNFVSFFNYSLFGLPVVKIGLVTGFNLLALFLRTYVINYPHKESDIAAVEYYSKKTDLISALLKSKRDPLYIGWIWLDLALLAWSATSPLIVFVPFELAGIALGSYYLIPSCFNIANSIDARIESLGKVDEIPHFSHYKKHSSSMLTSSII